MDLLLCLEKIIPFLLDFPSLPTVRNETENGTIWMKINLLIR